jgi:hypothetical protein
VARKKSTMRAVASTFVVALPRPGMAMPPGHGWPPSVTVHGSASAPSAQSLQRTQVVSPF